MQARLLSLINTPFNLFEVVTLGGLATWQGIIAFMSADTWDKITGPHGLVFVLIVALTVIWTKSVRDDTARERRHQESIKSQQEHFNALLNLNEKTSEDLKVLTVASTTSQITATNAIISMDRNIMRLTTEVIDNAKANHDHLEIYSKAISNTKK